MFRNQQKENKTGQWGSAECQESNIHWQIPHDRDINTAQCIEQALYCLNVLYSGNQKSIRFHLKHLQNSPLIFWKDTRDCVEAAVLLPGHYWWKWKKK